MPGVKPMSASASVVLSNDVRVNGALYTAGKQDVPAEVAEDLKRIDADYEAYLRNLNRDNGRQKNMGEIGGGGS